MQSMMHDMRAVLKVLKKLPLHVLQLERNSDVTVLLTAQRDDVSTTIWSAVYSTYVALLLVVFIPRKRYCNRWHSKIPFVPDPSLL